jgi:hypothetical protein
MSELNIATDQRQPLGREEATKAKGRTTPSNSKALFSSPLPEMVGHQDDGVGET